VELDLRCIRSNVTLFGLQKCKRRGGGEETAAKSRGGTFHNPQKIPQFARQVHTRNSAFFHVSVCNCERERGLGRAECQVTNPGVGAGIL